MALITGAVSSFDLNTNREDLADFVSNISPFDTPFMSSIGETTADNVNHEWSLDILAAVDLSNASLEGDETTRATSAVPSRPRNILQISDKNATVSGTQEVSNPAGISSMMAYQLLKKGRELKRDMESIVTQNQGLTTGAATTARTLRSLESWLSTNDNRGTGGTDATVETAGAIDATTGELRAFTEALLEANVLQVFESGGNPTTLMVGPANKQVVSDFTGRVSARQIIDAERIQASASLYASDFNDLRVVPNRFQRNRTAFVLDPEHVVMSYMRKFVSFPLSKIGDAESEVILSEYTLEMRNEAAHGVIADLL